MLQRHGTRNPSSKKLKQAKLLRSKAEALQAQLLPEYQHLKEWHLHILDGEGSLLSPVGEDELYKIGVRTRARYPQLFDLPFSPIEYDFRSTGISRTIRSAQAFSTGLFEGQGQIGVCLMPTVPIFSVPSHTDELLRFFDVCPKYTSEVEKNKTLSEIGEWTRWATLPAPEGRDLFRKLRTRLAERLGWSPTGGGTALPASAGFAVEDVVRAWEV
jgi:hypothetical protein